MQGRFEFAATKFSKSGNGKGRQMPRKKNKSAAIGRAEVRAASLASIDQQLDLGSGLTLPGYQDIIAATLALQEQYNNLLTDADKVRVRLLQQERALAESMPVPASLGRRRRQETQTDSSMESQSLLTSAPTGGWRGERPHEPWFKPTRRSG